MTSRDRLRRFRDWFLSAGSYDGEPRDQRGRRRIVVGILWVSVFGLLGGIDAEGGPVGAVDAIKAGVHLVALLSLWRWPLRITSIFLAMFTIDLCLDVILSFLYGGLYESGLQILFSAIGVLGLLVVATVRAAAVFLGLFIAGVGTTLVASDSFTARATLEDPESEAAFVLVVTTLVVFMGLFYFVRQRDELQRESDDLLRNILPDDIARRLKSGSSRPIADEFEDATVLFVDVVDFTPLSAGMTATELVTTLDDIFSDFDDLVGELGLEKIKTVGDEYMVASGIPTPRPDHAAAMADLALALTETLRTHRYGGAKISARIGINSGPVVAGIIGSKKFSYDLWGDVVNIASRMETHGVPGEIQITRSTYERIRDEFVCEARGTIEVKGKGPLDTWLLRGRRRVPAAAG